MCGYIAQGPTAAHNFHAELFRDVTTMKITRLVASTTDIGAEIEALLRYLDALEQPRGRSHAPGALSTVKRA